jgi:hypothetical protein
VATSFLCCIPYFPQYDSNVPVVCTKRPRVNQSMSLGTAAVPVKVEDRWPRPFSMLITTGDSYGSNYILFTSIVILCSSGVESADPPQQPADLVKSNVTAVALRLTSSARKSNQSAQSFPFHFALAATQNHADRPCYTHNVLAKFPLY